MGDSDEVQLVDCLAYMRPWIPFPVTCKTNMWSTPVILVLRGSEQEDQKFKIIPSYYSEKPAWDT